MPKPTLEEVDLAVAGWRGKLALVTENLMAFENLEAYCRLSGPERATLAEFTGVSAKRIPAALVAVAELFEQLAALTDVVETASRMHGALSRVWPSGDAMERIVALLSGPSLCLTTVAPHVPGGLLEAAQSAPRMTPAELLERMNARFAEARATLVALDEAERRLGPALAAAEQEADDLVKLAATGGESPPERVLAARDRLEAMRLRFQADPLAAHGELETELVPLLGLARRDLEAARADGAELARQLDDARARLAAVSEAERRNAALETRCAAVVQAAAGPTPPTSAEDLAGWLAGVERASAGGNRAAARVGVTRWRVAAAALERALAERGGYLSNLLELRSELEGRLTAFRAKARSRGVVENAELTRLAAEAERLLATKPAPLEELERLVQAYQDHLARTGR